MRAIALTVLAVLGVSHGVGADTLVTVEGDRYENVFVHETGLLYHVRMPVDGTTVHVHKSKVAEDGLVLSPRKERASLNALWRKTRPAAKANLSSRSSRSSYVGRPTADVDGQMNANVAVDPTIRKHGIESLETSSGALYITNRPRDFAKRQRGKTIYVGSDGIGVLTNLRNKFENDPEYTAVHIPYERIEVPQRFFRQDTEAEITTGDLDEIVQYYARQYRLDPALVYAVIEAESNFDPNAVSHAGARGLMQLMPATGAEMGIKNPFDPAQNVAGGTQYLALMFKMFDSETLALAAYNAGPGRIKRLMRIPQNGETEKYVPKVQRLKKKYERGHRPNVRIATGPRRTLAYLPPESSENIRIVLHNGSVTAADNLIDRGTYYVWEYKHRSGIVQKNLVKEVIHPSPAAD